MVGQLDKLQHHSFLEVTPGLVSLLPSGSRVSLYPIPRIAETLEALHHAKWFCSFDLQSGYLQVGVREADKPKTATTMPFGLYEFNRMPFG